VANGAKVYITGRRLDVIQAAADKYGENGKIIPIQVDLTAKDDVVNIAKEIDSKEPNGIHVLVRLEYSLRLSGVLIGDRSTMPVY
jgi:NADP-dependent 3-hydroxy acid dehydrogenase YdfG